MLLTLLVMRRRSSTDGRLIAAPTSGMQHVAPIMMATSTIYYLPFRYNRAGVSSGKPTALYRSQSVRLGIAGLPTGKGNDLAGFTGYADGAIVERSAVLPLLRNEREVQTVT